MSKLKERVAKALSSTHGKGQSEEKTRDKKGISNIISKKNAKLIGALLLSFTLVAGLVPLFTQGTGEMNQSQAAGVTSFEGMTKEQVNKAMETMTIDEIVDAMSLHEKVCQMFIVWPENIGRNANLTKTPDGSSLGSNATSFTTDMKNGLIDYPWGGTCFFARNLTSSKTNVKAFTSSLQANNKYPMVMTVDEEGGYVTRLGGAGLGEKLGTMLSYESQGVAKAKENGETLAKNCFDLGFNWDFAPVADSGTGGVGSDGKVTDVIGSIGRKYSKNYVTAGNLVAAAVQGFHEGDTAVATSLKHFPGHGNSTGDSHLGGVVVNKTYEQIKDEDLLPFRKGIEAGTDAIMMGHLSFTKIDADNPATFSRTIIQDILRRDMGFQGVVVTDGMDMGAATTIYGETKQGYINAALAAINAGNDMVLMTVYPKAAVDEIEKRIANGTMSEDRIDESVKRIMKLKRDRGIIPDIAEAIYTDKSGTTETGNFARLWSKYANSGNDGAQIKLLTDVVADENGSFGTGVDIDANGTLVLNGKAITIDLNGHQLDKNLADKQCQANKHIFKITAGGGVTIKDTSAAQTGIITGGNTTIGSVAYTGVNSKFIMDGGTLTGNKSSGDDKSSVVYGENGAIFRFGANTNSDEYAVSITGNEAPYAVYSQGITYIMAPLTIKNNGGEHDLYLATDSAKLNIQWQGLTGGANSVGISASQERLNTNMVAAPDIATDKHDINNDLNALFSNDNDYDLTISGNTIVFVKIEHDAQFTPADGSAPTKGDLAAVMNAAKQKDGTVTILRDFEDNGTYEVTKDITLQLNGKHVKVSNSAKSFLTVAAGGKLTIADSKETARTEEKVATGGLASWNADSNILTYFEDRFENGQVNTYKVTVDMFGTGSIDYTTSDTDPDGIIATKNENTNAIININGGRLTSPSARAICARMTSTVNVNDGYIIGCQATYFSSAIWGLGNVQINIHGGVIAGNNAKDNRNAEQVTGAIGLYSANGILMMDGGVVTGNISIMPGAGISSRASSPVANTMTISGGVICFNESQQSGGGIFANSPSGITISNALISHNKAVNGAGIYISDGTAANLSDAKIMDNAATTSGGGIWAGGATNSVSLNGAMIASGNTANGVQNNIDLIAGGKTLKLSGNISDTSRGLIGVTIPGVQEGAQIASAATGVTVNEASANAFFIDNSPYTGELKNNGVYVKDAQSKFTDENGNAYYDDFLVLWQNYMSNADASGTLQMLKDVSLSDSSLTLSSNGEKTLDLNGHTLSLSNGNDASGTVESPIKVETGELTVIDSVGQAVKSTETAPSNKAGQLASYDKQNKVLTYYVTEHLGNKLVTTKNIENLSNVGAIEYNAQGGDPNGMFTVYGSSVLNLNGGRYTASGGARVLLTLNAAGMSHINVNGGYIIGTTSSFAPVALIKEVGLLNITGGVIAANKSTATTADTSGCVWTANGSTNSVLMSGGVISGNSSASDGGMFNVRGKENALTVTGGILTHNVSNGNGGAIFYGDNALANSFSITDTSITSNKAINGGGVYANKKFVDPDCHLDGNEAVNDGGAVYVSANAVLDSSCIQYNTAGHAGGGVYASGTDKTVTIKTTTNSPVIIDNNTADGVENNLDLGATHTELNGKLLTVASPLSTDSNIGLTWDKTNLPFEKIVTTSMVGGFSVPNVYAMVFSDDSGEDQIIQRNSDKNNLYATDGVESLEIENSNDKTIIIKGWGDNNTLQVVNGETYNINSAFSVHRPTPTPSNVSWSGGVGINYPNNMVSLVFPDSSMTLEKVKELFLGAQASVTGTNSSTLWPINTINNSGKYIVDIIEWNNDGTNRYEFYFGSRDDINWESKEVSYTVRFAYHYPTNAEYGSEYWLPAEDIAPITKTGKVGQLVTAGSNAELASYASFGAFSERDAAYGSNKIVMRTGETYSPCFYSMELTNNPANNVLWVILEPNLVTYNYKVECYDFETGKIIETIDGKTANKLPIEATSAMKEREGYDYVVVPGSTVERIEEADANETSVLKLYFKQIRYADYKIQYVDTAGNIIGEIVRNGKVGDTVTLTGEDLTFMTADGKYYVATPKDDVYQGVITDNGIEGLKPVVVEEFVEPGYVIQRIDWSTGEVINTDEKVECSAGTSVSISDDALGTNDNMKYPSTGAVHIVYDVDGKAYNYNSEISDNKTTFTMPSNQTTYVHKLYYMPVEKINIVKMKYTDAEYIYINGPMGPTPGATYPYRWVTCVPNADGKYPTYTANDGWYTDSSGKTVMVPSIMSQHEVTLKPHGEEQDAFVIVFVDTLTGNINGAPKPEKDNGLVPIETADTYDLIDVNLYNYSSAVNNKYNSNNENPIFVWNKDESTIDSYIYTVDTGKLLSNGKSADKEQYRWLIGESLGDSLVTDWTVNTGSHGGSDLSNRNKLINKIMTPTYSYYDNAYINTPLRTRTSPSALSNANAIKSTLTDGVPVVTNNNQSLDYLFPGLGKNAEGVFSVNDKNINGLFLYDEESGRYSYSSQSNHAQYNEETGNFDVYDAIITPNIVSYQFGNFLPFQDINAQTTKVTEINSNYFKQISSYAKYKSLMNNDGHASNYNALVKGLNKLESGLSTGWGYQDLINNYWKKANQYSDIPQYSKDLSAGVNEQAIKSTGEYETYDDLYQIDYDEMTDFHFGMDFNMDFIMPVDGKVGADKKYDMTFNFEGDDDVWVFIDDMLFLNLTGIHHQVGGQIDFANGKVYYGDLKYVSGSPAADGTKSGYIGYPNTTDYVYDFSDILKAAGKTDKEIASLLNEKGTFNDWSQHNFKMFYTERGSGSGIMTLDFNLPVIPDNALLISKEVIVDNPDYTPILSNPDFLFQVLKADSQGNAISNDSYVPAGTEYLIYENGINTGQKGTIDENGIMRLKAGQFGVITGVKSPDTTYVVRELIDSKYAEQYKSVDIINNGIDKKTLNYSTDPVSYIEIAGVEYLVRDSYPIKVENDALTTTEFDNHVDETKLGAIAIEKEMIAGDEVWNPDDVFNFAVTFDEAPVPMTEDNQQGSRATSQVCYHIYERNEDGTLTRITEGTGQPITQSGIVSIKAGQVAVLKYMLAGSKYEIIEVSNPDNAGDYHPIYEKTENGDNIYDGVVQAGTADKAVDELPISKTIKNQRAENLVIGKEVADGYKPSTDFTFDIVINCDNENIDDTYAYDLVDLGTDTSHMSDIPNVDTVSGIYDSNTASNEPTWVDELLGQHDGTIMFKDGTAEISIPANKKIVIYGLPFLGKYTVKETNGDGYATTYQVNDSDKVDGVETPEIELVNTNGTAGSKNEVVFTNHKIQDLTITKDVKIDVVSELFGEYAANRKTQFPFTVTASFNNTPLKGIYKAQLVSTWNTEEGHDEAYAKDNEKTEAIDVEFVDGVASVELSHGQKLTIQGLPYGTRYVVSELDNPAYDTAHTNEQSDFMEEIFPHTENTTIERTLTEDQGIYYTNSLILVGLPTTGGVGLVVVALAILGGAMFIFANRRRKVQQMIEDAATSPSSPDDAKEGGYSKDFDYKSYIK